MYFFLLNANENVGCSLLHGSVLCLGLLF